jgi:hypothetical protein
LVDQVRAPSEVARWIWDAPFVVLSHGCEADPILSYGNRAALGLFELSWAELTRMRSWLTAESPEREERTRLLERVMAQGYIDDYAGVRVSRTGRRFLIEGATVWNLIETDGRLVGQAATFSRWRPV